MKQIISSVLMFAIALYGAPLWAAGAVRTHQPQQTVQQLLERSYLELFDLASEVTISKPLLQQQRRMLEEEKRKEESELKARKKAIEQRISRAQDDLKRLNRDPSRSPEIEAKRHELHCEIQNSRKELQEVELVLERGLDTRYEN